MTIPVRVPKGVSTGGRFAAEHRAEGPALALSTPPPSVPTMGVVDTSYRGGHQAPSNNDYCSSLDRLSESFGDDVYEHPEFYGSGEDDPETMAQLAASRGRPEAEVTIYRAAPPGVQAINPGDWVSLSRAYAEQHAIQDDDAGNDWPVISQQVPAAHVFTDGNDLAELGYDPSAIDEDPRGELYREAIAHAHARGGDPAAEATRAILAGTARVELAGRFAASGLNHEQLGERVGRSARVARRVVEGREPLNESTVEAYFRALD